MECEIDERQPIVSFTPFCLPIFLDCGVPRPAALADAVWSGLVPSAIIFKGRSQGLFVSLSLAIQDRQRVMLICYSYMQNLATYLLGA